MTIGILGTKLGMTQIFTDAGQVIPVTVIQAGPCIVLQKKTVERDGYDALQIGFIGPIPKRLRSKPVRGHIATSKAGNISFIREIRGREMHSRDVGDTIIADIFAVNEKVSVSGVSKGKGFQGVIKRHNFSGLRNTHGTHKKQRSPGSIGQCATPSRTWKGVGMPGRMGGANTTVKNLEIVRLIPEKNIVLIKGAVPGAINGKLVLMKRRD